jgi:hypothetical protein
MPPTECSEMVVLDPRVLPEAELMLSIVLLMTSTGPVSCHAFLSSTSDGRALLRTSRSRRNTGSLGK